MSFVGESAPRARCNYSNYVTVTNGMLLFLAIGNNAFITAHLMLPICLAITENFRISCA